MGFILSSSDVVKKISLPFTPIKWCMGRMTSLTTVLEPIGIAQNSIEKHDFSYLYTRVTLMRTTSAPAARTASSMKIQQWMESESNDVNLYVIVTVSA